MSAGVFPQLGHLKLRNLLKCSRGEKSNFVEIQQKEHL